MQNNCCNYEWCAWCCNLRFPLCCQCRLCSQCCKCPPPMLPCYYPPQPLPQMPCMGPPPPPMRIIREKVLVPVPYPICCKDCKPNRNLPQCWRDPSDGCTSTSACSPSSCFPCQSLRDQNSCGDSLGSGCYQKQDAHPCPWPIKNKRIYKQGNPIMPGYRGHIPGFRYHSAGRTFGNSTRDTCCIMSQWSTCCPELPCRIFEQ